MSTKPSPKMTALAIAMVAVGLVTLHLLRNAGADTPAGPAQARATDLPGSAGKSVPLAAPSPASTPAPDPIVAAITRNDAAALAAALDAGASPDAPGPDGLTPLMVAARQGSIETVLALLNAGATPAAKSPSGQTAADLARARTDDQGRQIAEILGQTAP